jgi:iron(III) transport system permease protein
MALLVFVALMLAWYGRLARHAEKYRTITGKGYRPRVMRLGRWRWVTTSLLVLLFLLIIGIPLAILLYASLVPFYEGFTGWPARLTLAHFAVVWQSDSFRESIGNTLLLGAGTTTLVVPLTAVCAWYAARRRPGGWLLDQLATAPLVFPAIVLGVAFLQLFLNLPFAFYGTLISIIVAAMVRELPYGMRYAYAGVLQMHPELEEASAASGARQHTTLWRIVLPLIAPSLATCWLFVFLNTVRQVAMPILLTGPRSQIVAVSLFELWENGQVTELAAMGVSWMVLMTGVSTLFFLIIRRYGGTAMR